MTAYNKSIFAANSASDDNPLMAASSIEHAFAEDHARADDGMDQLPVASPSSAAGKGTRRTGRAALQRLIDMTTSQYVIVTTLAGLTAFTVASGAAKIIHAKLELITAALKRF